MLAKKAGQPAALFVVNGNPTLMPLPNVPSANKNVSSGCTKMN
jgi:hypothetical protein